jgi:hypothetical protein
MQMAARRLHKSRCEFDLRIRKASHHLLGAQGVQLVQIGGKEYALRKATGIALVGWEALTQQHVAQSLQTGSSPIGQVGVPPLHVLIQEACREELFAAEIAVESLEALFHKTELLWQIQWAVGKSESKSCLGGKSITHVNVVNAVFYAKRAVFREDLAVLCEKFARGGRNRHTRQPWIQPRAAICSPLAVLHSFMLQMFTNIPWPLWPKVCARVRAAVTSSTSNIAYLFELALKTS